MNQKKSLISGILCIDKPSGLSSFDIIRRLRKRLGVRKIGHTGTLDPMATGLLVLVLGQATRLAPFIVEGQKRYLAEITFGFETNTYDAEGEVTTQSAESDRSALDASVVRAALPMFRGEISQRPPAFSAIKVDGKRAYALARKGESVELPHRSVNIYQLELVSNDRHVYTMDIRCSKGTYIRSLASDLGRAVGLGAHLSGLRRTEVGAFTIRDALPLDQVEADPLGALRDALRPVVSAVEHLNPVVVPAEGLKSIINGSAVHLGQLRPGLHRAMSPSGDLMAIVEADEAGIPSIKRGFPSPST